MSGDHGYRVTFIPGDIHAIETDTQGRPVGIGPNGVTHGIDVTAEIEPRTPATIAAETERRARERAAFDALVQLEGDEA